jgi:glycosyltransferase involved in cell wall biosynthesis
LLLRQALREAGWPSEIFAEATHADLANESLPVDRYAHRAVPGDVLIYQFSTSSMVADLLAARPEPLIIDYHNITPPELSEGWESDAIVVRAREARRQLAQLAPRAALGMADSPFNEQDLVAAGCRRTAVTPVLVDHRRVGAPPDPGVAARLAQAKRSGGSDWLFVGRVVRSKAQHELVKALWAYRRLYDPAARLHLVGSAPGTRYRQAIAAFSAELGLSEAVHLPGEVSEPVLAAYFGAADVYVSLSVHEGFGVPLVEAMAAGVPVVALGSGAVTATVGDGGLVLAEGRPGRVAATVHRVVTDDALRDRLVASARRRVSALSLAEARRSAVEAIASVAGPPPTGGRR